MDANRYQELAARTMIDYGEFDRGVIWNALGLVGEAGELANMIKKAIFHQHGINHDDLEEELGDCLWYIAALCTVLEIPLQDVMRRNIGKLMERYPDGFSYDNSRNR